MNFMNRGIQNDTVANVTTFFVVLIGIVAIVLGLVLVAGMITELVRAILSELLG